MPARVPQVTILPAPGFQRGANPSQLETRGRDGKNRTSAACSQGRCAAITRHPGLDPGVEPGVSCIPSRQINRLPRSRKSGPPESNRVSPRSERGRLPSSSIQSSGEVRNRTGSPTLARRGRCLTCHPHAWTARGLNPEPPPCQGGALPVGASSPLRHGARCRLSPGAAGLSSAVPSQSCGRMAPAADAHAMEMSINKPVEGHAGTAGVEPAFRPGWSRTA